MSVPQREKPRVVLDLVGYWADPRQRRSEWPPLAAFQQPGALTAEQKDTVARYLEEASTLLTNPGYSPCRGCGKPNGDSEKSDGEFLWPDGLAHYVREHDVVLPERLLTKALTGTPAGVDTAALTRGLFDGSVRVSSEWWKDQASQRAGVRLAKRSGPSLRDLLRTALETRKL